MSAANFEQFYSKSALVEVHRTASELSKVAVGYARRESISLRTVGLHTDDSNSKIERGHLRPRRTDLGPRPPNAATIGRARRIGWQATDRGHRKPRRMDRGSWPSKAVTVGSVGRTIGPGRRAWPP